MVQQLEFITRLKSGKPIIAILLISCCGIIRGCATIKMNTRINVVYTRLVPHCATNRGCDINRGNTVYLGYVWLPFSVVLGFGDFA